MASHSPSIMGEEEMEREIQESSEMEVQAGVQEEELTAEEASPRGVLESPVSSGDSDHSSSNFSSCSIEKSAPLPPVNRDNAGGLPWKLLKAARRLSAIPLMSSYDQTRKSLKRKLTRLTNAAEDLLIDCGGIAVAKPSWRNFNFTELAIATNNFSAENLVGEGGNAKVYKGYLSDGQVVAIKKLINDEKDEEDRIGDFLSELGIIAHINHPNAARLLGFSVDDGLHLVLEFSPHGSLASLLHGAAESLEWKTRFKVALGIAEGLQYLHHECHRRIIHRDIKASNILLTQDYEAQISDFGLAKWLPENWVHHIVFPIEGTFGYLSPEYFMHGIVDEKTDVFAYGVLLLEIITGRHAVDSSRQSLAMWAKPLLDTNNARELVDPRLGDAYDHTEMKRAMLAASICIDHASSTRPYMKQVVQVLKGEDRHVEVTQKTNSGRALILDGSDMHDYTCTNYINDLNRHMQLVLE